jgi:hypothetical protein
MLDIEAIKRDLQSAADGLVENIWLSESDSIALGQRLSHQVEINSRELEALSWFLESLNKIICLKNSNLVEDCALRCYEEYNNRYRTPGESKKSHGSEDDSSVDKDKLTFSVEDMALSKKEAQSKLSPLNFRLWKKAQKALKKRNFDDEN